MDLALYKEFYQQEWQRHEHLQSAVNTPISIVTLLAGGLVLMAKGFETPQPVLSGVFWSLGSLAAVLVGTSVYFLVRSIHGYHYERLPFPSELARHYRSLVDHYEHRAIPRLSTEAFEEYLASQYAKATNHNTVNNVRRGKHLERANRFLVYALCATASTAVPAGVAAKTAQPRPQDIRITNLGSDVRDIPERRNAQRAGSDAAGRPLDDARKR